MNRSFQAVIFSFIDMDEQSKFAFTSITDICKQIFTLATGILALEITFTKDIARNPSNFDVWLLESSWILLAISIFGGLLTLMAIAGTVGQKTAPMARAIYGASIKIPFGIQFLSFMLAVVISLIYGTRSI